MEKYLLRNKATAATHQGLQAYSLLSPPAGDPVSRRRVRMILKNVLDSRTDVFEDGTVRWGRRTPHIITLAVTYDCQFQCRHCSAFLIKEQVSREKSQLQFSELRSIIEQTIELGTTCVIFTGGEPLLHHRIYDLIAAVDRSLSLCTLFTNGERLDAPAARRLREAGAFGVYVSLDHSRPEVHDRNRGRPGLFLKAVEALRHCQKEMIPTGISTFITREKLASHELEAMMDLARELKVLEVFLFDVIPTGRYAGKESWVLSEEESRKIKILREEYNARPEYPRLIHQTLFASLAYPCAAEGCPAGNVYMHIRGNGDVSPCDFTPLSFGNIREKPLKDIWESMARHDIYAAPSRTCRYKDPGFCEKMAGLEQQPFYMPAGPSPSGSTK